MIKRWKKGYFTHFIITGVTRDGLCLHSVMYMKWVQAKQVKLLRGVKYGVRPNGKQRVIMQIKGRRPDPVDL